MPEAQDSDKEAYLREHILKRYGVSVTRLELLDRGVISLHLADGQRWIARIFSPRRALAQVEADAHALRLLAQHGFPAERCAVADAVSTINGWSILVTEYVDGTVPASNGRALQAVGEMLGRLHTLPLADDASLRQAGALHHYAPNGGGPEADLAAAASWLAGIEERVPAQSRVHYDLLREQIATADTGQDLPLAFIHPDPVLKNLIATRDGELVYIDWTGAGRGPRIASFAVLLWSGALGKGGWSPRRVDALVLGYRSQVQFTPPELARLAGILRIRPLVFACRRFCHAVNTGKAVDGREFWLPDDDLIQAVGAHASERLKDA